MNEQETVKKLKVLDEVNVYLAEFEHVFDVNTLEGGHIDPNVLSAGAFPLLLRNILNKVYARRIEKYYILDIPADVRKSLFQLFKANSLSLSNKEIDELSETVFATALHIYNNNSEMNARIVELVGRTLSIVKSQSFTRNYYSKLRAIFSSPVGWASQLPETWPIFRTSLVKDLFLDNKIGGAIQGFSSDLILQVQRYLLAIISNLDLPTAGLYSSYKVEFEGDLGYAIKYIVERDNPNVNVNVWNDLHHNSGLVSLVPLGAIAANISKKKFERLYKLLVHGKKIHTPNEFIIMSPANNQYKLVYELNNPGKVRFYTSETQFDELNGVYMIEETLTEKFDQYAYLWEYFDKKNYDINSKSHNVMYLSNVLNAKGSLFEIYNQLEAKYELGLKYPETKIIRDINSLDINDEDNWVLKEGGLCSTGGKGVVMCKQKEITGETLNKYHTSLLQKYINDLVLRIDGVDHFGHIRKLSVLDSSGNPVHLGYIIKACAGFNSSAFRTCALFYDESGEFIYGVKDMSKKDSFFNLEGQNIEILLPDIKRAFAKVRSDWLIGMYYINKFCNTKELKNNFNSMVKEGIISESFLLH